MADKQTELLALLQQLQTQLRNTQGLDPSVAGQIKAIVEEIEATLPSSQETVSEEDLPVTDRLRQAALEFKASHPTLSQTVGNIADTLAQMGI